jgi:radical SAM superfamily enzyme YgiQ (UPF0313 family)
MSLLTTANAAERSSANRPSQQAEGHTPILLCTLNAKYIHSAFGLRYLKANMAELESQTLIREFTLEMRAQDIVEQILSHQPKVVGFGVYIWNVTQTTDVVSMLKTVAPQVKVVLGGPEVSYEHERQEIVSLADHLITGWGEVSFAKLCQRLLLDDSSTELTDKVIVGEQAKLSDLTMPYYLYGEDDIANRLIYVEASRGCPFKCEFCLSALDKTAWPFDIDLFLDEMNLLLQRGAKHFKFVDRTFNLKIKNSLKILDFFLDKMTEGLFLHFEVVPDHLPDALKEKIAQFPAGSLQFEIGIQTFNPEVQNLISRRQNNQAAQENLAWIRQNTQAHIHADLIFGLPGDDLSSFSQSFDTLYALSPHEIQVGILKRLKGSPIIRHTREFDLRFNPAPPFNVLSSSQISFDQLQVMNRFARYWDMIANSGRFTNSLSILISDSPFLRFSRLSESIFQRSGRTHKISLLRLFDMVYQSAEFETTQELERFFLALEQDFLLSGLKSKPKFLQQKSAPEGNDLRVEVGSSASSKLNKRQSRH